MPQDNATQEDGDQRDVQGPKGKLVTVRSLTALFLWGVLLFLVFHWFAPVRFLLLAFLTASALAATLRPLVERVPGPKGVVAIGSMLTLVLIVGGLGFLLVWTLHTPIAESLANWPSIKQQANDVLLSASDRLRLEDELTVERLFELGSGILTGGSSGTWLNQAADSVSTIALALLVILIATMYLLSSDRGSLSGPAIKLLPARRQEPTRQACEDLECHYRWWAIGTSFSMLVIGVTSGLGYWIVGLDFALALGILAGLTQAIPTFGPMLALAIALAVAATQGLTQLIGVGAVYVVVQTLESYFLTPMVMMRAVHIPPIVTLFTVIFWGNIFGVAGLILAVPIDLTIWALLKHHIADFHRRDDPMEAA